MIRQGLQVERKRQAMLANKQILIINESTNLCYLLHQVLTREGAQITGASSGAEGLALARGDPRPDLILLDLSLQDMPGLQVLRRLRETDRETAIVLLIGAGGARSAVAGMQEGADGYVDTDEIGVGGMMDRFLGTLRQALDHRAGVMTLAKTEQLKTDFFSMVTHDLRNPAGSIKTAILMLLEDETGPLNSEQRALIEIAQISADKLINLINNYLDYARIDAGFLELVTEETDLREIVRVSARPAALEAEYREQTLRLDLPDCPVRAEADAHRLGHAIDNLLGNAIKYTPRGGRIDVRVWNAGDHAAIQVSDTGYGIPPDQIPELFQRFRRARDSAARGIRGTGLGLLIVKEIVERHGGTVEVISEGVRGKGSTFTVRLPQGHAVG
jgi:signal transduction histidine kinase